MTAVMQSTHQQNVSKLPVNIDKTTLTLHNDITRCTGVFVSEIITWETECPRRDKCLRYTDKPRNAVYVSMMNAPKIRKRGCELKIEVRE